MSHGVHWWQGMVSAKAGVVLCQAEGREVGEALGADLGVEARR